MAKGLALVDLIRDVHALFMRVKFPSTVRCSVVTQLADLEYVLLLTVQQSRCNVHRSLQHANIAPSWHGLPNLEYSLCSSTRLRVVVALSCMPQYSSAG